MDVITIADLEVFYCVGVPDEERAQPQRLLLTVEMEQDFRMAANEDDIGDTIDALTRYKAERAIPSWEDTFELLLKEAGES